VARPESSASGPGSRALVVDVIRSSGPISRVELTETTGLTQPSISNIVRKLLVEGIVRESGRVASGGGKPRTLIEINPGALYAVGVQLGFESMTFVATGAGGGIVARQLVDGASLDSPDEVTDRLVAQFDAFVDAAGISRASIAGVAVVAPGPLSADHGAILRSPTLRRWEGFSLRDRLSERLDVPVLIDNDAAAAAVGEFWTRRVPRTETFAGIYMGTGLGAGIIIDGALYRGASSNAGELGHTSVDLDGEPCFCGNRGCVERYAAPAAVLLQAREQSGRLTGLGLAFEDHTVAQDFDRLARAAVGGHPVAESLIATSARYLAAAVVSFVNVLDVDRLVLSGPSIAVAGSVYARAVRERLMESAFARQSHDVRVELATNPRDSAAIGAAALVLQSSVSPGHGPQLIQPN
jgi:predicted NBD/HSP70 family sugar kinase